jgi:hypothetical protein
MRKLPVVAELFEGDRQTSRHDEANSRFLQFRENALVGIRLLVFSLSAKLCQTSVY